MDILDSKERRAEKQSLLIDKYNKTLISFTLNIPGREKYNKIYRDIHIEGINIIKKRLNTENIDVLYIEEKEYPTGREGYIVVDDKADKLKKISIDIEEGHPLGRIFDIDIFSRKNEQISRSDLGTRARRCLLCDNDARICMREKNHTYKELIENINKIWLEYIDKK